MLDHRRNVVTIIKLGAGVLERLDTVLDAVQDTMLAPLTPNERNNLVCLLAKLA